MKTLKNYAVVLMAMALVLASCSTVPITGRKQLDFIPGSSMLAMSVQEYDAFLKSHKLSTNQKQTQMVKLVGTRIQGAVEQFFAKEMRDCRPEDYLIRVNRQPVPADQVLREGDRISFTPTKIEGAILAA